MVKLLYLKMGQRKFFYLILAAALAIGAGIMFKVFTTRNFTYNLKGCQNQGANSLNLSPVGNSLKFVQVLNTYCNAQENLTLNQGLSGKNMEIREVFDGKTVARCVCPLAIEGQINGLEKGKYNPNRNT